jgi:hypothetical protein
MKFGMLQCANLPEQTFENESFLCHQLWFDIDTPCFGGLCA